MKQIRKFAFALALGMTAPSQLVVAQTVPSVELQQSVQLYAQAWGSRDADRIVALHTEDSIFQLFVDGAVLAKGKDAIKTQFQKILTDNPGYSSTVRSVAFGDGFVVIEYDIKMDPPKAFTLGDYSYTPNGKAYPVPAIDVIKFKNGLVTSKVTYLDTGVARANSESVKPIGQAK